MVKKEESKKTVKNVEKKTTKKTTKKKESFIKSVKKELTKVKWPTVKDVVKYTIATIGFVLIVIVFFGILNLVLSFIKGLFV